MSKATDDATTKGQHNINDSSKKKHDISILKYDNKAYAKFVKFEKDLEETVGYEFGDLFSFAKTGVYPYQPVPTPRSIQTLIQEEKDAIPPSLSVAERAKAIKAVDAKWDDLDDAQMVTITLGLEEEFKAELRAHSTDKLKRKQDKIKLFWLIKSLLSTESLDAVKQYLLEKWATLEATQDPLEL